LDDDPFSKPKQPPESHRASITEVGTMNVAPYLRRRILIVVATRFFGTSLILLSCASSNAYAWGCDGHRAITMLAERLLTPGVVANMRAVLAASPIDPAMKPYCLPVADDPIADASTWADDNRTLDPSTAGWHFINFPRVLGADLGDYEAYCRNGDCVVDAIVAQFNVLTTTTDPRTKGNALRYILHFVGDLHQPLHTTTNGDRGGNCLPVTYYDQPPMEDEQHNFRPNLHSVWDDLTIRRLMTTQNLRGARALADYTVQQGSLHSVRPQAPTADLVASWAKEANVLARRVTYGWLPVNVPMERANTYFVSTCDQNNHVSTRLAKLNERVDAVYEGASVAVILGQFRVAAERLAAILKAAFPESR